MIEIGLKPRIKSIEESAVRFHMKIHTERTDIGSLTRKKYQDWPKSGQGSR